MRKQVKNIALVLAASMLVSMAAPAVQTVYAGTEVYTVTLGTAKNKEMKKTTMLVGETMDLNFYGVKDWGKNKQNYLCKWSVEGDSVSVDGAGTVTALKAGTSVVHCSIKDRVTGVSHNVTSTQITVLMKQTITPKPTATPKPTVTPAPTATPTPSQSEVPELGAFPEINTKYENSILNKSILKSEEDVNKYVFEMILNHYTQFGFMAEDISMLHTAEEYMWIYPEITLEIKKLVKYKNGYYIVISNAGTVCNGEDAKYMYLMRT